MAFSTTDIALHEQLQSGSAWVLNVGGSFDPPHRLHLDIAEAGFKLLVMRLLDMTKTPEALQHLCRRLLIVFMPTKHNSLKPVPVAESTLRVNMLAALLSYHQFSENLRDTFYHLLHKRYPELSKAAAQSIVKSSLHIHISKYEITRPGPSYTVDTSCAYREYEQINYLSFALGSDNVLTLPRWHMVNDFLRLIDTLLVAPRMQAQHMAQTLNPSPATIMKQLFTAIDSSENADDFDRDLLKSRLQIIDDFKGQAVSSTQLRHAIAEDEVQTVETHLCPDMLDIIQQHHLYQK